MRHRYLLQAILLIVSMSNIFSQNISDEKLHEAAYGTSLVNPIIIFDIRTGPSILKYVDFPQYANGQFGLGWAFNNLFYQKPSFLGGDPSIILETLAIDGAIGLNGMHHTSSFGIIDATTAFTRTNDNFGRIDFELGLKFLDKFLFSSLNSFFVSENSLDKFTRLENELSFTESKNPNFPESGFKVSSSNLIYLSNLDPDIQEKYDIDYWLPTLVETNPIHFSLSAQQSLQKANADFAIGIDNFSIINYSSTFIGIDQGTVAYGDFAYAFLTDWRFELGSIQEVFDFLNGILGSPALEKTSYKLGNYLYLGPFAYFGQLFNSNKLIKTQLGLGVKASVLAFSGPFSNEPLNVYLGINYSPETKSLGLVFQF